MLASKGKRPAGVGRAKRREKFILAASRICKTKIVGGSEDAGEQWRLT